VIAGFGERQIFPALRAYTVDGKVDGVLKYVQSHDSKITFANRAAIVPFAQHQMVSTFMEGIDPYYAEAINGALGKIFQRYPLDIVSAVPGLNEFRRQKLGQILQDAGRKLCDELRKELQEYKSQNHVVPITEAVSALPMDELAAMAESLVNLTSFKQKVSLNAETVGGPIDVAVISKGDGFIWIKRKHYFRADLNPHFFAKYGHRNRVQSVQAEDGQ